MIPIKMEYILEGADLVAEGDAMGWAYHPLLLLLSRGDLGAGGSQSHS